MWRTLFIKSKKFLNGSNVQNAAISECIFYRIEIRLQDDTLWLTQHQIAELYEKTPPTINEHLKNIYDEGELEPDSTIRKFRIVALEGKREVERLLDHYNLEAVLAVGFWVHSSRETQFRQWASDVLKEYLVKGFAMAENLFRSVYAYFEKYPGQGKNIYNQ